MFLAGDNNPCNVLVNEGILKPLLGFSLLGDFLDSPRIRPSTSLEVGSFVQNHFITTGVSAMSEGVTIAKPSHVPQSFRILGRATDGGNRIASGSSWSFAPQGTNHLLQDRFISKQTASANKQVSVPKITVVVVVVEQSSS